VVLLRFKYLVIIVITLWHLFFSTGCLVSYLVRSGVDQTKLLSQREKISDVLKNPDLPPAVKHKLQLSLEARQFAEQHLGLKQTENYTTYVELDRPHVSYIVLAAKKHKLEQHLFWYPIVGKLPYKGFFEKSDAEKAAKDFDATKFDVLVRGVSAYSTLGWFEDPLLSSMLQGEDHHVVALLIHESTHATMYFKSQADFNERLATFIEDIGTEAFYLKKEGENSATLKKIKNEVSDQKLFSQFISREIDLLKKWYDDNQHLPDTEIEVARQLQFKKIQESFIREVTPKLKTTNYTQFAKMALNNAQLLHLKTYMYNLDDLHQLYEHFNKDIRQFLTFCKSLEKSKDPSRAIADFLRAAPQPQ